MKKNCIGGSYKSYLRSVLILCMMIGSMVSYSYGEERKINWGFPFWEGWVMHSKVNPTWGYLDFFPISVCLSIRIGI
jgi:hypothetical protein